MQCPKCSSDMETRNYGRKISVQRCTNCYGLWCKPDVLLEMKKEWMSEALDRGDPSVGKQYDKIDNVQCPECQVTMNKVADEKQTHIWYETCPQCDGMFFDAGEFSDLKYDTLMDRLRDLIKGRRK